MVVDTQQQESGSRIEADVVIVGGGLAGITLARQVADAGYDVVLLESGGEEPDERAQSLYAGRMTLGGPGNSPRDMDEFLTNSRVRRFGGTGNVWGGKCGPLDPMDFARRDWVAHSGWPLDRLALQPWYDRACELLELPKFDAPGGGIRDITDGLLEGRSKLFTPRARAFSPCTGASPLPHYTRFKQAATSHPRIRVHLRANLTHIQLDGDGRRVQSLRIECLNGRSHTASGRLYILATGGIENARLLLVSDDVHRTGIGNHSDWLGRGFAGHATIAAPGATALCLLRDDDALASFDSQQRARPHAVIGASDAVQAQTKTANFTATLAGARSASAEAAALKMLAMRLSGVKAHTYHLTYFMIEQTPNRSSRITLSDERDDLGMRRVRVDMRYNEIDFLTLERMVGLLACELGRLDAGRLQWAGKSEEVVRQMSLSRHHMGTTRMAASPSEGVVDEFGRVHGVPNLFVAGSSVFPTGGIVNPTLTLLALAYRTGDQALMELRA
jgi:choline dehydrogenase-like flavoprotein